MELRVGPSSDE